MATSIPPQTISGLASGLDTTTIISQLMAIEQQPQNQIKTKISVEQARQQAYQDVLTRVQNLASSYQALTDPSTWADAQTVDTSDPTKIGVTRTAGAAGGAYDVNVLGLARANQFGTTPTSATTAAADDQLAITVATTNPDGTPGTATTNVNIAAGDSFDTIATKINGTSATPVYASVLNGQLVLSDKQTGTAAKILSVTAGASGLSFGETQTAQDASYTLGTDPTVHTSGSNIVTNAFAGLTLTLKATGTATVTVGSPSPDTQGIQDKIQTFVDQYNSTLSFIQGKLSEQTVAVPKTPADQLKGVLHADSGLTSLLSTLRNAFSDPVTSAAGDLQTLAQVGVSTGATTGTGSLNQDSIDGKITFDTDKFSSLLSTRFDDVKALFTNNGPDYSSKGIANRLSGILDSWTAPSVSGGILNTMIDGESSTIKELQNESDDWDTRLALKQQQLQAQFTAMETALGQAQAQGQWLAGQISSLPRLN